MDLFVQNHSVVDDVDEGPEIVLKTRKLSEIKPQRVKFLWPGRIPEGKFTMGTGLPDQGKSLFALMLAAYVSNGNQWPDGAENGGAGRVLICAAEDDAADTIAPRLANFGADLSKIEIIDATFFEDQPNKEKPFMLDAIGIEALARHAERNETKLLIIDTISHFFAADLNKAQECKQALKPLVEYAARYEASIFAIEHMGKSRDRDPLGRVMGSTGLAGQARYVWGYSKDPNDPDRIRMVRLKGNLSRCTGGLAFRCESVPDSDHPKVIWENQPCMDSPWDVFCPPKVNTKQEGLDDAMDFLRTELESSFRFASKIYELGGEYGFSKGTLQKAGKALGVVIEKSGFQGKWRWSLPKNTTCEDDSLDSLEPF